MKNGAQHCYGNASRAALSPAHLARLVRLVRTRGIHAAAIELSTTVPTLDILVSGGKAMRTTVERITWEIEEAA